ncbi:hypothetical protein [Micromonospora vulcania]
MAEHLEPGHREAGQQDEGEADAEQDPGAAGTRWPGGVGRAGPARRVPS